MVLRAFPRTLSRRLWRVFYKSFPRHPLFWNEFGIIRQQPKEKLGLRKRTSSTLRMLSPGLGLLILCPIVWLAAFPGFLLLILFILGGGTLAGLHAALGISTALSRQYKAGHFDVVALTPSGLIGASWALAARFLRTNRNTLRLHRLITGAYLTLGFLFVVGLLMWFPSVIELQTDVTEWASGWLTGQLNGMLLVGLLYFDFLQSTLMGALIAMVAPTYANSRIDTNLAAVGLFLVVQLSVYVTIGLLALGVPATLFRALGLEGGIALSLIHCIGVLLIREVALWYVWRMVAARLNTDLSELEALVKPTQT